MSASCMLQGGLPDLGRSDRPCHMLHVQQHGFYNCVPIPSITEPEAKCMILQIEDQDI